MANENINAGHGNWNTGDRNTGNRNTGDRNTGDRNTGHWNNINDESGHFCTLEPDQIRVFNSYVDKAIWDSVEKPDLIYFDLCVWVEGSEMTDQEKKENPDFHFQEGYLKSYEYKEAFKMSWDEATEDDRKLVEGLPNFDADVFLEISGIDVRENKPKKEITIDGLVYVLKQ